MGQTSYVVVPMMTASIDMHSVNSLVILMLTLTDHAWKTSLRFPWTLPLGP